MQLPDPDGAESSRRNRGSIEGIVSDPRCRRTFIVTVLAQTSDLIG